MKALKRIRDFLEDVFGMDNEGHSRVDEYRLAKIRMDVEQWEVFISECYLVLRAMREPVEMLGTVYQVTDCVYAQRREDSTSRSYTVLFFFCCCCYFSSRSRTIAA